MLRYPIREVNVEKWEQKVSVTYMYSIPLEDTALPALFELSDILWHLNKHPLPEVIVDGHVEYFFTKVFPPVCIKIIKSRYFKYIFSDEV
jgi:hypothetical protein